VFRESVRDRVPFMLVIFALLLIAASYLLAQLTAGQDVKIIKDLGLAATEIFGLFIALFIGVGLVAKEVERRSIYAVLSKPVSRSQFIAGKYAGLVLTLAVHVAVMTGAVYLVLVWMTAGTSAAVQASWDSPAVDPAMVTAVLLIFIELMMVTAIALFFSTFSSPILSAALTFGLYVIGYFNTELKTLSKSAGSPVMSWLAIGLYRLLPDFAAFDMKTQVVHGLDVPAGYIGVTTAYGLLYVTALLAGSAYIFSRRDLK
jgi:Cu-processing system permease protein